MFNVTIKSREVVTVEESRRYALTIPGQKDTQLLWSMESHLKDESYPDATHIVMAHNVKGIELAALALACLDELNRLGYFTDDNNGPPPVQCAADVRAYISRQLVIAHNQAAANMADQAAADLPVAQDDWAEAHQDWAGPF